MEMLQSESSAEKYLYLLMKKQNEKFLSRRLRNWECFKNIVRENYVRKKNSEVIL